MRIRQLERFRKANEKSEAANGATAIEKKSEIIKGSGHAALPTSFSNTCTARLTEDNVRQVLADARIEASFHSSFDFLLEFIIV
ncbi:hypothetical protein L1049_014401 [Liquidambar formosana]|uniref:Uncharacterized protein n=1 Tax=Liquidambar formosana TaxID=63359 RepID=A0AAP0WZR2_LIQFO